MKNINRFKEFENKLNELKYKHMYTPLISDEEDDRWETWGHDFEREVVDFIEGAKKQCYEIGGEFRGPGYWATAKKMIELALRKAGK